MPTWVYVLMGFVALIVAGTIGLRVRTRWIAAARPGESFDTFCSSFGGTPPFQQEIHMRWHWLLIPAVALLSGADTTQKPQEDEDRIQGTWNVVSSEREGKTEPGDEKALVQLEFAADTFRFRLPSGARHTQPYKLDPSKKTKTIDWLVGGKHGPSKPLLGIYELEGDTLKICWGEAGKARPQEFKTKAGTEDWLWILKRAKKE